MKRFIDFGKIPQFRGVIKDIKKTYRYNGVDEDNKPAQMPTLEVQCYEKIHGTNGQVLFNNTDGIWCQSRKNILNLENNNAGFFLFVDSKEEVFTSIIQKLANDHNIDLNKFGIALAGEWAGGNIQKKSCVSGLDKMFIIFKYAKVFLIEDDDDFSSYWIDTKGYDSTEDRIHNVATFGYETLSIDFDRPDIAQAKMIEMVEYIENNSKIGKFFGKNDNIGEGYVCFLKDKNGVILRFKIKGEKHSQGTGRITKLSEVDIELENTKRKFVNEYACTPNRLDQMWTEMFGSNNEKLEPSIQQTGNVLRWLVNDVWSEETDIAIEMGLEPKSVNSLISKVGREYFIDRLNNNL